MWNRTRSALVTGLLILGIAACPSAAPEELDDTFAEMQRAWTAMNEGRRVLLGLGQPVQWEPDEPETEYGRLLIAYRDARNAFMDRFAASDWDEPVSAEGRKALSVGLAQTIAHAMRDGDPDDGVRAAERLLDLELDPRATELVVAWRLPVLLTETTGIDAALTRARELLPRAKRDITQAHAHAFMGDAASALGRVEDALAAWKRAERLGHPGAGPRRALLGRAAPALPDGTWVGEAPTDAERPRLLLFLGSSDYEGLALAVRVAELRKRVGVARLDVVGIVHPVNGALLPESRAAVLDGSHHERAGGAPVEGLTRVHERLDLGFPLLVDDSGRWAGTEQHRFDGVLLDSKGQVVAFGGREGRPGVLSAAVERLLDEPPDED